jgi:superfamily II RNA helicase
MTSPPPGEAEAGPAPDERSPYGFALDPFQLKALEAIDHGTSVLVAAPTGSGKTVVAEHAVARALAAGGKAFYTTPIKALSNQKFADLARRHGAERVGLLTGDNSINGDAPVVVMTTEVLRNMIYTRSPALAGLQFVVLDEVHYLQDAYRGPVWEEVIIHLPPEVRLVCLSATVSNAHEVAEWLVTVRGPTTLVLEERRPVELRNLYLVGDRLSERPHLLPTLIDGRPNREAARFDSDAVPGRPSRRGHGRRRRRFFTPRRPDVIELLGERDMLPALYFIFSRAACDEAVASSLDAGLRLTTSEERARIRTIAEERTAGLSDDDLDVLGYDRWVAGLEAGLAAHHAGMVPPFKETVEACFVEGLVKAVFATETLALGINMPARSVVIERLTKFTGESRAFLTPGEYTQLTGRAGRRGIDELGYAIVLWSPFVAFEQVAGLATSRAYALRSAFRPTYNMAANLVRSYEPDDAHHLLNLSFGQFQADRAVVRLEARARQARTPRQRERLQREVETRTGSLARQFDRVLRLLEDWNYLDGWALTRRGEVLARTYHECDLLVAEAMTGGLFDDLDPASLAGLASCFTYESRRPGPAPPPRFPSRQLRGRWGELERLADELRDAEEEIGLPPTRQLDAGFVELAHAWAAGEDLADVLGDDELSGGDFVRNTKTLIDLLRQIGDVAPDPVTATTARRAADAIHRGVVSISSTLDDVVADGVAFPPTVGGDAEQVTAAS